MDFTHTARSKVGPMFGHTFFLSGIPDNFNPVVDTQIMNVLPFCGKLYPFIKTHHYNIFFVRPQHSKTGMQS